MSKHKLVGTEYYIVEGEVESTGNAMHHADATRYAAIRFTDGATLRNVMVDGTLTAYVAPGSEGRFAITKVSDAYVVAGVEQKGLGFRGGDPTPLKKIAGKTMNTSLIFTLFALVFLAGGFFQHWIWAALGTPVYCIIFYLLTTAQQFGSAAALVETLNRIGALEASESQKPASAGPSAAGHPARPAHGAFNSFQEWGRRRPQPGTAED